MQNQHRAESLSAIEISELPAVAGGFVCGPRPPCPPYPPYHPVAPRPQPCRAPGFGYFGFGYPGFGSPGFGYPGYGWFRR